MSSRITCHPEAFSGGMKAKPEKAPGYLAWIRTLPCVISGSRPVEATHLSAGNLAYGHTGRGKQQKASDRWALPLTQALHIEQGLAETAFWDKHGETPI
jgi:hypothetical protein